MERNRKYLPAMSLAVIVAAIQGVGAGEIRLQLKGGGFEITGELYSYDGASYVVNSPAFGKMTIDGRRFDCLGDNCPKRPVNLAPTAIGAVSGDIVIAGSNTIGSALMPGMIEAFAKRTGLETTRAVGDDPRDLTIQLLNKGGRQVASLQLSRHDSSAAFRELETRQTEIGMSSRRITDPEVAKLAAAGLGNMLQPTHEHILGLDGLLIVVGSDNAALSISIDNVAKIFAGEINDWSQVGLPPGPINVHAPAAASGTFETFDKLVLKPRNLKLAANVKHTENQADLADLVASDPLGIGIVGLSHQRNAKALNIQAACGLISRPTRFAMKTEEYPLTRRLYLYTPGTPKASLARQLLTFTLSNEAQEVVTAADLIDQRPEALAFKDQGARIAYALNAAEEDFDITAMRSLLTDISQAMRLTTTLRFETGSFNLDSKAVRDTERLAQLLETPDYQGKNVLLIGFADSVGAYESNLRLSQRRAEAVAAALKDTGLKIDVVTKGYSELAPVACNDTTANRQFNRRVEVWVN